EEGRVEGGEERALNSRQAVDENGACQSFLAPRTPHPASQFSLPLPLKLQQKPNPVKTVSPEIIAQVDLWLDELENERHFERLMDELSEDQPILFAYLMTMGENDFNDDEKELMFFLGLVIWQAMLKANPQLPELTEARLEKVREVNLGLLEISSEEEDVDLESSFRATLAESPQPHLLAYAIDVLFDPENGLVDDQNLGPMLSFLKIEIDALDA
ncbi:MAG: hypothetical protein AAF206_17785, partial [Bacteroidota bacterium]